MSLKNNYKNKLTKYKMDLNVESLDAELEEFDINNIEPKVFDEDIDNECIIYSYPYFNDNVYDYEFRVTVTDDTFILEEVRCNDEEIDFEKCIEIIKTSCNIPLSRAIELINNNIDLRDENTSLKDIDGIINLNINSSNKNAIIEQNKKVVLKELYQEIRVAMS